MAATVAGHGVDGGRADGVASAADGSGQRARPAEGARAARWVSWTGSTTATRRRWVSAGASVETRWVVNDPTTVDRRGVDQLDPHREDPGRERLALPAGRRAGGW